MSDAYVYFFTTWDAASGQVARSERRATLDCIKGRGEPLMETQLVVDQRELDDSGFLCTQGLDAPSARDRLWAQIRSLRLRAESRDHEALALDETTDGASKYMLLLESRELREQARKLTQQRIDLMTDDLRSRGRSRDFEPFAEQGTAE